MPFVLFACGFDYCGKFGGYKRSAADKSAVNIDLSEKLCRVLFIHRAAVLDGKALCRFLRVKLGNAITDDSVIFARVVGSCDLARADSPYRLIGDDYVFKLFFSYSLKCCSFSVSVSPTQRITLRFSLRAALTLS